VCTGLGVATKTGHLGEVESEPVLQPVHGVTRTTGKNTNEIVSCKFTSLGRISYEFASKRRQTTYGFLGVLEENLCAVGYTCLELSLCAGTVDTRSCLGRVASHEATKV
jgi:hypothetical protein